MFCKAFVFLSFCICFETVVANPIQGNQQNSCSGDALGTLGENCLDDGETLGASFAQAGMKCDNAAHSVEEEEGEDLMASYEEDLETLGMSLLQYGMDSAAEKVSMDVVEEDGIQEDSSDDQLSLQHSTETSPF